MDNFWIFMTTNDFPLKLILRSYYITLPTAINNKEISLKYQQCNLLQSMPCMPNHVLKWGKDLVFNIFRDEHYKSRMNVHGLQLISLCIYSIKACLKLSWYSRSNKRSSTTTTAATAVLVLNAHNCKRTNKERERERIMYIPVGCVVYAYALIYKLHTYRMYVYIIYLYEVCTDMGA